MTTRTYTVRFVFEVGPEDPGFDDPEWIADAAHGALTNDYGITCTYGAIEDLTTSTEPAVGHSD